MVSGDGITAIWESKDTRISPPGSYPISGVVHDPKSKLANYTMTDTSGTLTVTKATPEIAVRSSSIAYGKGTVELVEQVTFPNKAAYPSGGYATATLKTGSHTITVKVAPDADYNEATKTGTLTVKPTT